MTLPAESITQAFNRQAQLLKHAVLTKAGTGYFHELINLYALAMYMGAPEGTQCEAKSRRAFTFAIARIDDHQAAAFAFGFIVGFFAGGSFDLHF